MFSSPSFYENLLAEMFLVARRQLPAPSLHSTLTGLQGAAWAARWAGQQDGAWHQRICIVEEGKQKKSAS
jgi:hypothetical protein